MPGADLSEQISTAGMEASGTGNMKFALNGAVTIGTLDGANVEMLERLGDDNIVIFGLTVDEVAELRASGYDPGAVIESSPDLGRALGSIASGVFSVDEPGRYRQLVDSLYVSDPFLVAADFDAYLAAQQRIEELWADRARWAEVAIRNVARMSWFSSDRTHRPVRVGDLAGTQRLTAQSRWPRVWITNPASPPTRVPLMRMNCRSRPTCSSMRRAVDSPSHRSTVVAISSVTSLR